MSARVDPRIRLPKDVVVRLALGGCALGVAARLIDEIAPKWVGNVGAMWFLAGFLAGVVARVPRLGVLAGPFCLCVATVAYYAVRLVLDPISMGDLAPIPLLWLVMGAAIGVFSGWLGARSHRFPETWGAPAGVFLGEAIAVVALRGRMTQALLEVLCAVACLGLMKGRYARGVLVAAVTVPNVALFAVYYRLVLWWG